MPALLASTSIDLNRDNAVSTILAAVAGSPMCPSTRATWLEAATSVDWVIFRELATTLKPRSANAFTIPAPIPCEPPVTMAVFGELLMVVTQVHSAWPRLSARGSGAHGRNGRDPAVDQEICPDDVRRIVRRQVNCQLRDFQRIGHPLAWIVGAEDVLDRLALLFAREATEHRRVRRAWA